MNWQRLITARKTHLEREQTHAHVHTLPYSQTTARALPHSQAYGLPHSQTRTLAAGSSPATPPGDPNYFMPVPRLTSLFSLGALWMHSRLQELQPAVPPYNPGIRYTGYGLLKYGICLTLSGLSIAGLSAYGLFVIPVSIAIFYLSEVHFLFLFPILIDRVPRPLLASIRATYKIGIGRCLITVIPIAIYMMIGLFRKTNRLSNWYIGCLAIIIWYDHEIRNRI
jgi:hypothetical protein